MGELLGTEGDWPGAAKAWFEWGRRRGICDSIATAWSEQIRHAREWLLKHHNVSIMDCTEDELRAFLRTPQARLTPICTRFALSAALAFLVDTGFSAHAYMGIEVPEPLYIDTPPELDGIEIDWTEVRFQPKTLSQRSWTDWFRTPRTVVHVFGGAGLFGSAVMTRLVAHPLVTTLLVHPLAHAH